MEAEQELSVVSDCQSVASEQSSRLSERLTALRMEAAKLEAERATAKSSAEQLRGLEHAMRGDREQKLQLIDRYTQEAAELEKTLQAEQDKLAGQDAAAFARFRMTSVGVNSIMPSPPVPEILYRRACRPSDRRAQRAARRWQ